MAVCASAREFYANKQILSQRQLNTHRGSDKWQVVGAEVTSAHTQWRQIPHWITCMWTMVSSVLRSALQRTVRNRTVVVADRKDQTSLYVSTIMLKYLCLICSKVYSAINIFFCINECTCVIFVRSCTVLSVFFFY